MPPYPTGSVQQQLTQQYSYLFQMAQQLNMALTALESGAVSAAIAPSGALSNTSVSAPAAQLFSPLFIDHTPFVCSLRQSVLVNGSGVSLTVTPT